VLFPEIGFEIPSGQKGQLTTVEGLLNRAVEGLQQDQPVRRIMHPEVAGKIDEVIEKLKRLMTVDEPFTVVLDDPCGNSFIENLCAPSEDPLLKMESYQRSHEQDIMLGIQPAQTEGVVTENVDTESTAETTTAQATATTDEQEEGIDDSSVIQDDEILTLPTCCPQCHAPSVSRIKPVQIPFFKEVIIMALTCDACGYRSNEVKSGSGISETGTRITLRLTDPTDLSRDILKVSEEL
jgi:zinc finger protein